MWPSLSVRRRRLLEEEAQAGPTESADDACRNCVRQAAKTERAEPSQNQRTDAGENINIRRQVEVEILCQPFVVTPLLFPESCALSLHRIALGSRRFKAVF